MHESNHDQDQQRPMRRAQRRMMAVGLVAIALWACSRQTAPEPVAASASGQQAAAAAKPAATKADKAVVTPLRFAPPPTDACVAETTRAARRALDWALKLDVDPARLRTELDMQGKKHFTELLGLLRLLAAWPGDAAMAAEARSAAHRILDQFARAAAFHDLADVDDGRFDEDSMSYLRGCWYAQELGWDTRQWRAAIDVIAPRVVARLSHRGNDQRMSFTLLFAALGLPEAESVASLYAQGAVANHRPFAYWVASPQRAYELTHEIFGLTGSR